MIDVYSYILIFYIAVLGLVLGSFINVVIFRINKGENFILGRSHCMHCKNKLKILDLIPVFSFLFLRGRCRYCNKKISIQYPLVELSTSFLLVFTYLNLSLIKNNLVAFSTINPVLLYLFMSFLVIIFLTIFVYDLKYYLIPDGIVIAGFLSSVVLMFYSYFFVFKFGILDNALGLIIFSGFFAIQHYISGGKWVGWGDVNLGLLLGFILGLKLTILSLIIAYVTGAIISLILIALKLKTRKDIIPFGPFLIAASFLSFFYGNQIIGWYLSMALG